MTTKWNTQDLGKGTPNFGELLKDESTVVLLRGKNPFGDMIYSYLKIRFCDLPNLQTALQNKQDFVASDFGTVVAAGTGEPSDEVKAEMSLNYTLITQTKFESDKSGPPIPPLEKKEWDEY